ncbi:cell surface hyaluronidase-like [Littorina saxatilis]|uniref:G8 domain-containing protein n=1 Tax=Littorina saxatilis TaxID=31220 RepID=A0AAN9AWI7_9CAEN
MTRYVTSVWMTLVVMTFVRSSLGACPDKASGLQHWSDVNTWPNHKKPTLDSNSKVVISDHVLIDEWVPPLHSITINKGASLIFSPWVDHDLRLHFIHIYGDMHIGSHDCKFPRKVNITLIGKKGDLTEDQDFGEKYIGVAPGGTLELHGEDKLSWTKLTATVHKLRYNSGLHYEHKYTKDRTEWQKGVGVFVFDHHTGALSRKRFFQTAAGDDWTRKHDPPAMVDYLNKVQDGEVVALAVQHTIKISSTIDLRDVYRAVETLAYGHVTGNSTIRGLQEKDAFVLITQKGNPDSTVESVKHKTGSKSQLARVSLTLMDRHLKVTAMSYIENANVYPNYVNVRSMTTTAGYPTIHTVDDVSTWKPGDRVVLTSTDYMWQQAEEATVVTCTTCNGHSLKLDFEAQYEHWGEITDGVDMRGEVGLLTRNILIQGEMEDSCPPANGNCQDFHSDTFGGHIKIVKGFKNVHIEGVELYHMGQQTSKGRYPIHFHLCYDVDSVGHYDNPAYVRSNSIHYAFSRCVTVHGTHGLTVADNVAYHTYGHCFFLEDGGEKRNVFDGNLGLSTRNGKILPSDSKAATFWLTSPLVTVKNNVAAGGEKGPGFWYIFPDEPQGPSKALGFMQRNEARHTPYTEFTNNVAHSYFQAGLFADNKVEPDETVGGNNDYEPHVNPLDTKSPQTPTILHRLTAYKNMYQQVWVRGGWFVIDHASLSDSAQGITMASSAGGEQFMTNSIIVGESRNGGEPTGIWSAKEGRSNYMPRSVPLQYAINTPIQGFIFYDGPVYGENIYFNGFVDNENRTSSALGFHRHNYYGSSPVSSITNGHFGFNDGHATGNRMFDGDSHVHGFSDYDGDIMATFRDTDGSVTGVHGGAQVVKPGNYFTTARCYVRDNWKVAICPHKFGELELYTKNEAIHKSTGAIMVRDDRPNDPVTIPWHEARSMMTILGGSHSYTLHWTNKVPADLELRLHGAEKDLWVRIGVCIPRNADFELLTYAPHWKPERKLWISLNSVHELDADTTGYAYFWDKHTGLLFFKFQNFETRTKNVTSDCLGNCANVHLTIKSGDLNDKDCRHRAYGPYKRAAIDNRHALHSIPLPASDSAPPKGWGAGATLPFKTRQKVDGGWGSWSVWSACTKTCGGGIQTRLRACNKPRPQNGGHICEGNRAKTLDCHTTPCQQTPPLIGR